MRVCMRACVRACCVSVRVACLCVFRACVCAFAILLCEREFTCAFRPARPPKQEKRGKARKLNRRQQQQRSQQKMAAEQKEMAELARRIEAEAPPLGVPPHSRSLHHLRVFSVCVISCVAGGLVVRTTNVTPVLCAFR